MNEQCIWAEDEDGNWLTDCAHTFLFTEGSPTHNGMKFCCYCGQPLVEKPYVEPTVEDEL